MPKLYPDAFYVLGLVLASIVFGWTWALRTYRKLHLGEEAQNEERRKFLGEKAEEGAKRLIEAARKEAEALTKQTTAALELAAGLSSVQAKEALESRLLAGAEAEIAPRLSRIERDVKEQADAVAQRIISTALQRLSAAPASQHHVSVVALDHDDLKGRIIGREGRNIRHFEKLSGTDLLIDDTPGVAVISCHHPERREIAALALSRLVKGGVINQTNIEEALGIATSELQCRALEDGRKIQAELALASLDPDILTLVGKMRLYETGSENLLSHSLEVAHLSRLLAAELGLNTEQAARAGLLHDIGKLLAQDLTGDHAAIGADFLAHHGVEQAIVTAVSLHHRPLELADELSFIVEAANSLSHQRPGANREATAEHLKRVKTLEEIAQRFPGVEQAYAIQSGRELRVLVSSRAVSDEMLPILARDIAKKIESSANYPGAVKVCCIREISVVQYAE